MEAEKNSSDFRYIHCHNDFGIYYYLPCITEEYDRYCPFLKDKCLGDTCMLSTTVDAVTLCSLNRAINFDN